MQTRHLIPALLLTLSIPSDADEEKPTLLGEYQLSRMAVDLRQSRYASGFVSGEQLLSMLRSLRRAQDSKPLSKEEQEQAVKGLGFVAGVYEAFLDGLYTEHLHYSWKVTSRWTPQEPPLCGSDTTMGKLVEIALALLESQPKATLKTSSGASYLEVAFLQAKAVYRPCKE